MPDVTLTDPLGHRITLRETTWVRHIVRRHPAVGPYRAEVELAITAPTAIQASLHDPDCLVYYGQYPGRVGEVQVVVDIRLGTVKTAFLRLARVGRADMAVIDAVEGILGDTISFHYDLAADVLYLRRLDELGTLEVGQEDEQGFIVLHAQDDLRVIGVTIVSFWKRYGRGDAQTAPVAGLAGVIDKATGPVQSRLRAA